MLTMLESKTIVNGNVFEVNTFDAIRTLEDVEYTLNVDYNSVSTYSELLDYIDWEKINIKETTTRLNKVKREHKDAILIKVLNDSIATDYIEIAKIEKLLRKIEDAFTTKLEETKQVAIDLQSYKKQKAEQLKEQLGLNVELHFTNSSMQKLYNSTASPEPIKENENELDEEEILSEYENYYDDETLCEQEEEISEEFATEDLESINVTEQNLDNDLLSYVYSKVK